MPPWLPGPPFAALLLLLLLEEEEEEEPLLLPVLDWAEGMVGMEGVIGGRVAGQAVRLINALSVSRNIVGGRTVLPFEVICLERL